MERRCAPSCPDGLRKRREARAAASSPAANRRGGRRGCCRLDGDGLDTTAGNCRKSRRSRSRRGQIGGPSGLWALMWAILPRVVHRPPSNSIKRRSHSECAHTPRDAAQSRLQSGAGGRRVPLSVVGFIKVVAYCFRCRPVSPAPGRVLSILPGRWDTPGERCAGVIGGPALGLPSCIRPWSRASGPCLR